MQKYGKIENGELQISSTQIEGYKPIIRKNIPENFDQLTQYVQEYEPIENDDEIIIELKVKEMDVDDEEKFNQDL